MAFDATFWVAVSFIIFCGGLIYLKIPQKITETLDKLILDIKNEIEDLKNKVPEKINKIAIEISTDVIRQLTSIEVNNSSISAIVNDLSKDKDKYYGI